MISNEVGFGKPKGFTYSLSLMQITLCSLIYNISLLHMRLL